MAFIALFSFSACSLINIEEQPLENGEVEEVSTEINVEIQEETEEEGERIVYENPERGISFSLPASWVSVGEQPYTEDSFVLYSFEKAEKSIIIKSIDLGSEESVETAMGQTVVKIGETEDKEYFALVDNLTLIIPDFTKADQVKLQKEVETIAETFSAL